jgi:hypothetical protein
MPKSTNQINEKPEKMGKTEKPKIPTVEQISAGGAAFRMTDFGYETARYSGRKRLFARHF